MNDYGLRQAWGAYRKRVRVAAAGLVVLGAIGVVIWRTGVTWNHLGVVAQWAVAVIAVGGYVFTYRMYREQEDNKYRPALTASFALPSEETRKDERARGWLPGFVASTDATGPTLKVDFTLTNISESPVAQVRMNFYLHDYRNLTEEPNVPRRLFGKDISIVDGLAGKTAFTFKDTLRQHQIQRADNPAQSQLSGGAKIVAFDFQQLFSSFIPSESRDTPATRSAWSLVFSYKNLQRRDFFSVYKWEAVEIPLGPLPPAEYFQMVYHGSFSGAYLDDDKTHQFVANRGFPSAKEAPDWRRVQATLDAHSAQRSVMAVSDGHSGPPAL